jgi:hypothetical protein
VIDALGVFNPISTTCAIVAGEKQRGQKKGIEQQSVAVKMAKVKNSSLIQKISLSN